RGQLGLPDDLIQKGKDIKSVSEIEQNGDHFKVTVTTGTKVMVNSFTVGQEAELETLTGEKIKVSLALCRSTTLCAHGNCHAETGKGLPQTVATKLGAQNCLECQCML
uniref:Uncharacterized protein n=1 Tax=Oncorhynchus tshawytscha TaxID=74940 RepID=A0A8C8D1I7_ONCTS